MVWPVGSCHCKPPLIIHRRAKFRVFIPISSIWAITTFRYANDDLLRPMMISSLVGLLNMWCFSKQYLNRHQGGFNSSLKICLYSNWQTYPCREFGCLPSKRTWILLQYNISSIIAENTRLLLGDHWLFILTISPKIQISKVFDTP